MHFLPLIFLFFACSFSIQVNAQEPPSNEMIDGVHIKTQCDMDTIIRFHTNAQLVISDSTLGHYQFNEGSQLFCEIIVRTTDCRCKDCSYSSVVLIDATEVENLSVPLPLTPQNTSWLTLSIWTVNPFITDFRGTLDLSQNSMEIYRFFEQRPDFKYNELSVQHEHLK